MREPAMMDADAIRSDGTEPCFFDLDGTLVDSGPGIDFSVRVAVRRVLASDDVPDVRPFIGPSIERILRNALGITDPSVLVVLCNAYRESYDHEGWRLSSLYPGVVELFEGMLCRGRRCILLTNKPAVPTNKMVAHFKLEKFLSAVLAPGGYPGTWLGKPQALRVYCEEQGLLGRAGWVVGDSLDDAEAAALCGFRFVACRYGFGDAALQKEFPVAAVIDCLPELLGIIGATHE